MPNDNYCKFEDWVNPILHAMTDEQVGGPSVCPSACPPVCLSACLCRVKKKNKPPTLLCACLLAPSFLPSLTPRHDPPKIQEQQGTRWTPSKIIERLGREIDHPDSISYWAARQGIPVFCPALTDGSLGDMMYFFSYKRPEFAVDLIQDIRRLNDLAVRARATGMIILGGGLVKHHTCNANLMRNGADFAVFVNTAQEFDGSDAGARPDEAISWGKVRIDARPVKVYADATLVFPLLVAQTFAKGLVLGGGGGAGEREEEEEEEAKRRRVVGDEQPH